MTNVWLSKSNIIRLVVASCLPGLIASCSTEKFANAVADRVIAAETTTTTISDNPSIPGTPDSPAIPSAPAAPSKNQTPVISGKDIGEVTEDFDGNKDGVIAASGDLNISDDDPGESAFVAESIKSNYGDMDINSNGYWFYILNNDLPAIQNLNDGESVTDSLTVRSLDGTTHTITVTILGADEAGNNGTNPQPIPPIVSADIKLTWTAPAIREDNSGISLSEIAGYKIYYGNTSGNYDKTITIDSGNTDNHILNSVSEGTYYFVITTQDIDGRESKYSSEITLTI